ncbi:MAG: CDP-archaeol synthase [Candidatus Paracaedibacteraceae bacterium]|nr:CDP-archaeol synthase [Candidatus Paracaedibacteraceae bacterium]
MNTRTENVVMVEMFLNKIKKITNDVELVTRILSAGVLIPIILWITYTGGYVFYALSAFIYLASLREWSRLSTNSHFHPLSLFAALSVFLYHTQLLTSSTYITSAIIFITYTYHQFKKCSLPSIERWAIFISGIIYLTVSMECFVCIQNESAIGSLLLLWIYSIIWATDSGAYILGKTLKGPKLCPRLSPNKTWSGFVGGTLSAILIGSYLFNAIDLKLTAIIPIFIIIAILSISAHIGDLIESSVKRYFGVKNAGQLIPGHGGILDRLDSLFLVCFVAKVLLIYKVFSF